jgi:hypothetical protein
MRQHEFWRKRETGEIWAVELVDGVVAGTCGPLDHSELDEGFLEAFDYDTGGAASVEADRDTYELYDVVTSG